MSVQPFRGSDQVCIEKRTPDGRLDFSDPQPPKTTATFDEVYRWFFVAVPDGVGSWEALKQWLDSKGWQLRAKTW